MNPSIKTFNLKAFPENLMSVPKCPVQEKYEFDQRRIFKNRVANLDLIIYLNRLALLLKWFIIHV